MAKNTTDLTLEGHINGDADGLGPLRGAFYGILIELGAVCVYGLALYFGVWHK